jgi:hypothetical protein
MTTQEIAESIAADMGLQNPIKTTDGLNEDGDKFISVTVFRGMKEVGGMRVIKNGKTEGACIRSVLASYVDKFGTAA